MYKILYFFLCVFVCACSSLGNTDQSPLFDAQEKVLDNGMRIVVVERQGAPVVTHMLWLPVGAADEVHGTFGAAHVLEHLMFKGAGGLKPGEYSRRIGAMGGQENAFTGHDATAYYATIPVEHLPYVMKLEAARLSDFAISPAEAKREIEVVRQERKQRTDSDPQGLFEEALYAVLFPDHPYGRPVIGRANDLKTMNLDKARAFWATHYDPARAIVVVSGGVDADAVFALAHDIYAPLSPKKEKTVPKPINVTPAKSDLIVMHHAQLRQPIFARLWRVPSLAQDAPTAYALMMGVEMLGGGPTSWLYRRLVVEESLASAISFSYDPYARQEAVIMFVAWPKPGVEPDRLENALTRALADFEAEPQILMRMRNQMSANTIYARDSLDGPAYAIGGALITGTPLAEAEALPQRLRSVSRHVVQDTVYNFLLGPKAHFVTGALLPYSDSMKRKE